MLSAEVWDRLALEMGHCLLFAVRYIDRISIKYWLRYIERFLHPQITAAVFGINMVILNCDVMNI